MADFLETLLSRRSVRRFLPRPVAQATLQKLIEAAVQAPSAHSRQPWRFAVLNSTSGRERLAEAMGREFRRDLLVDGLPEAEVEVQVSRSRARILEAPAAILLCLDISDMDRYPDEPRQQAELWMAVQSVAMAGENLLLAAHSLGLGGVWLCAPLFAPQAACSALDLPESWQPQGLALLGYPAKIPEARPRRPLSEVVLER